jgi:hypothetical protein
MKTDGNDSAFPLGQHVGLMPGLTKREYFAAMAMQGMIATDPKISPVEDLGSDVANWSVLFADALIEALNK